MSPLTGGLSLVLAIAACGSVDDGRNESNTPQSSATTDAPTTTPATPSVQATVTPTSTVGCIEIHGCLNICGHDNASQAHCPTDCTAGGSPEAIAEARQLPKCANACDAPRTTCGALSTAAIDPHLVGIWHQVDTWGAGCSAASTWSFGSDGSAGLQVPSSAGGGWQNGGGWGAGGGEAGVFATHGGTLTFYALGDGTAGLRIDEHAYRIDGETLTIDGTAFARGACTTGTPSTAD